MTRNPMPIRLLLALTLTVGAAPALRAQPAVVPLSTPVETLARDALGSQPGVAAAAAWREGRASYAVAASGTVTGPPVATGPQATLFEIGSISKVFTGLLLAQAVEAGELSLDDTVGRVLQGKVDFSQEGTAQITLRQLVTHTSCLPRLPPDFRQQGYVRQDPYRAYDRARLWKMLGQLKLADRAPCDASYSNLGFAVLGEALSERYGKPWAELVRERITAPLGMRNTLQSLGPHAHRLAQGFDGEFVALPWDMLAFAGAGALRSTAEDLLIFGRAILAGRDGPLGAAGARLVTPLARFDGQVAYGLFVNGPPSRLTYGHTGGTGAFRSVLTIAPDTQEVVVLMASNAQSAVWRIANDMLVGRYPVDNASFDLPAERITDYQGVFRETRHNAFTLVAQDGRLYLRSTGAPYVALTPSGPDSFNYGTRAKAIFERKDGRVASLRWQVRGDDRVASRSDEALPAAALLPQQALDAYVGRYRAPRFDFHVRASGGQLSVQLTDQDRMLVYPVAGRPDRFAWDLIRAEIQFERWPNGAVRGLVLHQNGMTRAERLD
ncbi:serine hydrolase [Caenimonas sedimenti]|uniref:Beta-lactamase n=1 Tax=Caenimonas sedimenti TaxID=2596921 RepID=A0A562ZR96_9BURK|nr:serine hydrolase [Caenimonas sedimenti]TWO70876.1 serine hydrolase [Caenimonas sedimenti]